MAIIGIGKSNGLDLEIAGDCPIVGDSLPHLLKDAFSADVMIRALAMADSNEFGLNLIAPPYGNTHRAESDKAISKYG